MIRARILLLLLAALGSARSALAVERWGVFELGLRGAASGNPSLDVQWSATFSQGEQRVTVPGFYDGEGVYKVRFSPPAQGSWKYETRSDSPDLNGKSGSFYVEQPTENNHGPVEIFQKFYLRYADGSPYHQFGTTCYAWVHQTRELQEQTLKTLAESPFNKIRFCIFPKSYVYNRNEPEFFAFQKGANGKFDFSRPDPAFWRHFEQCILDLQRLGIEADIILWHPYDRWGFANMSPEQDDRYLRYCIARLSAFRNVWWSLANEYDFMTNQPAGRPGNKRWEDWDRFFSILQKEDPHQRMRGIHNGARWYDHTKDWVTHASLQTSDMNGGVRFRARYGKPVIYDECRYEGDIPQGWGNLTARQMLRQFWLGTLGGCYVGHGETYKHPEDILWWAKGGVLHGQSPTRIQWLKRFMADAPPFHELQPLGDDKGRFLLAKSGAYYLLYCLDQRKQTVSLAGDQPYKLDLIDPWNMTITPVGTAPAGDFSIGAPKPDMAYRFVPYGIAEKLRPEAKISASVTEGVAPLAVRFGSSGNGKTQWDFDDGAASDEPAPTHIFPKPGLYFVSLTVTDAEGGSGRSFAQVAVDRKTGEPIVRAGVARDEIPALKLHGTARRTDTGSLHLPDGAPWGWVQAGDEVLEDLRGLRSFTILGWLRPESLRTGSGGNRIVFCLNRDHAGIDLVCHADGRLRLAVNQWPDSVQNDSSPGKLEAGKWTFFAVTYDATRPTENVGWYFSPPMDSPGKVEVRLDRKTSYRAGPVDSDVGPLAIGNFNATMRSAGLDRQFRGEIRGLQLLGSRAGGRGALTVEAIQGSVPAAGSAPSTVPSSQVREAKPVKTVADVFAPLPAGSVKIGGWLGGRMDACMDRRVMAQNIERLVAPFRDRNNGSWDSEYWGKWYTSAVFGYLYQPSADHKTKIDEAVRALLQTQSADGQITGFDDSRQFGRNWDIWGRKYALLGLIAHYDATGDAQSLKGAQRAADAIAEKAEQGMVIGERCLPYHNGVQSTSILAEFAMLYARTGDEQYRKTAELIVKQWDTPNPIAPKALRLMTDALANKPPAEIGSRKCYETLANYEGLLELYRATGDSRYLDAVSIYLKNVLDQERMIHGSLSNNEEWFYGVKNQTAILEQPVETCVTAQWMLICWQMLRLRGEAKWADELEISLYNALLGVMTPDGHWWSYFAHLNGERIPCPIQHPRVRMTCCVTSGPRGLLLTPQWAVMKSTGGIVINLYAAGTAVVKLDGDAEVEVLQKTSYPETGDVSISVAPKKESRFKVSLRIPSWSKETKLSINGQSMACEPGHYAQIDRVWSNGDRIELVLDMRGRAIKAPSGAPEIALARGPILLALDSRLAKIDSRAIYIDVDQDGYVPLRPVMSPSPEIWLAFEVPVYTRRGPGQPNRRLAPQVFCDYASAGNQFVASNAFRTWLPQPLHLESAFPPNIWKLGYGNARPPMPSFEQVGP
jgi:uncharacterized protein